MEKEIQILIAHMEKAKIHYGQLEKDNDSRYFEGKKDGIEFCLIWIRDMVSKSSGKKDV